MSGCKEGWREHGRVFIRRPRQKRFHIKVRLLNRDKEEEEVEVKKGEKDIHKDRKSILI